MPRSASPESPRITFHGAAREVTGSCHLIESNGASILFDCGFFQGGRDADRTNRRKFPFDPRALDAVVISHAHLDHTGLLPRLVRDGFDGPIHATPATIALAAILLADAAHLQEDDAERQNRHNSKKDRPPVEPLYTQEDVQPVMALFRPLNYGTDLRLPGEIVLRYHDAGHILGSALAELEIGRGGSMHRLVMSGDLGPQNAPFLRNPTVLPHAHSLVMESTYGDRDHRPLDATLAEFEGVLHDAIRTGGHVIIPAFAVGRTQNLLYYLADMRRRNRLPFRDVFVDSPMAIQATHLYRNHPELFDEATRRLHDLNGDLFEMPGLRFTCTAEESRALNDLRTPAVIISASGMCTGGRILHHLRHNLARPEAHVIFAGFQAVGTLGRALVDRANSVKIFGEKIPVKAHLHTIGGFSAHAGRSELLAWHAGFRHANPVTYLVHGEENAMDDLADAIGDFRGRKPVCPNRGDSAILDARAHS